MIRSKLNFLSIGILLVVLSSCASSTGVGQNKSDNGADPSENAVLWQQTAAEYDALCLQAFALAKKQLDRYIDGSFDGESSKPKAVVMDLDETVLDNSPYNAMMVKTGKEFSKSSWDNWVAQEKAELVPGAYEFIEYARNNQIQIYFISNRDQSHFKSTLNNLLKYNIEVNQTNMFLRNSNSKKERRDMIQEHEVVLLIGDNLADFHEAFEGNNGLKERDRLVNEEFKAQFGYKFIILPNPMYGDWYQTLDRLYKSRDAKLKMMKSY